MSCLPARALVVPFDFFRLFHGEARGRNAGKLGALFVFVSLQVLQPALFLRAFLLKESFLQAFCLRVSFFETVFLQVLFPGTILCSAALTAIRLSSVTAGTGIDGSSLL